jgi:hypothetical protein
VRKSIPGSCGPAPLLVPVREDIEAQNLAALGDYISELQGAGMELFPDSALENQLLRVAGLPKPDHPRRTR